MLWCGIYGYDWNHSAFSSVAVMGLPHSATSSVGLFALLDLTIEVGHKKFDQWTNHSQILMIVWRFGYTSGRASSGQISLLSTSEGRLSLPALSSAAINMSDSIFASSNERRWPDFLSSPSEPFCEQRNACENMKNVQILSESASSCSWFVQFCSKVVHLRLDFRVLFGGGGMFSGETPSDSSSDFSLLILLCKNVILREKLPKSCFKKVFEVKICVAYSSAAAASSSGLAACARS